DPCSRRDLLERERSRARARARARDRVGAREDRVPVRGHGALRQRERSGRGPFGEVLLARLRAAGLRRARGRGGGKKEEGEAESVGGFGHRLLLVSARATARTPTRSECTSHAVRVRSQRRETRGARTSDAITAIATITAGVARPPRSTAGASSRLI